MMSSKPKIIFWGTSELGVPVLDLLLQNGYPIIGVISAPDAIAGRGQKQTQASAISQFATQHNLPLFQPETLRKNDDFFQTLIDLKADLGILVAYGKLIPERFITLFPKGIINLHPSLLPKYRGPSPLQTAILNGDTQTGLSLMLLDQEMDHGEILAQAKQVIEPTDTTATLSLKLARAGAELLIKILPDYLADKITPQPQDHTQATISKIINKLDGQLDWTKTTAQILNQIRAFTPWPGTYTKLQCKILKIIKARAATPTDIGLRFHCADGEILAEEVQLEGKKKMTGDEFLRGYKHLLNK
ncbi:MAG: methionyl-tRNA formyltransferase [Candidatus Komeilibacteria bacterium]|nr:methionyl-tRNA formyltransferase [Candidatus Komeilibacteria bacterium]